MTLPCPHTPLVSLVPDVLLLIFSHLSPSDLSRLSRTCRRLLTLVDRLGWRRYVLAHQQHTFLDRSKRSSSSSGSTRAASSSRSAWFYRARFFHLVSQAWLQPWFIAHQRSIPTPPQITHKQLDFHRSAKLAFAIPRLVVGAHALVLALRSELYLYHPDLVREPTLLHLNSQAQASLCPAAAAAAAAAAAPRPGPWQDVTAMTRLDHAGHMLFLGFADGVTQVVRISTRRHPKHAPSLRVVHAFASHSGPKHEIADLAAAIATADHARVRVLASITRRGRLRVAVLPLDLDAPPVRVDEWQIAPDGTHRPAHEAGAVRTRAWSLLVGGDGAQCWIAVGITGDPALFIYTYSCTRGGGGGGSLGPPRALRTPSSRPTSVYALAAHAAHLYAGFYDGTVRVYDTRATARAGAGAADPVAEYRDPLDDTPVYSLALAGPHVLAGAARHAQLRVWNTNTTHPARSGWSAFATYPADSPIYALAADTDRVWGATDRILWTWDLAPPPQHPHPDHQQPAQSVAFFRHNDRVLHHTDNTPAPAASGLG